MTVSCGVKTLTCNQSTVSLPVDQAKCINKVTAILFNQRDVDCISLNLQRKALRGAQAYSASLRL